MIRIDSHNHFWKFDPVRDSWIDESMQILRRDFLPKDLLPRLDEHEINGTIAVQADQSEDETNFLLDLADRHNFIKGVVGWIDFRAGNIEQRLLSYSMKEKLCGFRHIAQTESDDKFLIREDFLSGLRHLKPFNFTYDILIYPSQLPAAISLVDKLPHQMFVIDHIAKPPIKVGMKEPWASQMRELALAENVYCKLSGIITEADHDDWNEKDIIPYLEIVFDAFGAERLMFGSDWPVCLLAGSYREVILIIENYFSKFSEEVSTRIFGENAMKFYNLKVE